MANYPQCDLGQIRIDALGGIGVAGVGTWCLLLKSILLKEILILRQFEFEDIR